MAYRDQYDYGDDNDYGSNRDYESNRDYGEGEGFFDRVRGWFRERANDFDRSRNQDYGRRNRDYGRDYGNYRNQQQRGYRSNSNRDYNRDYGYSRANPEWERTRQWRRNYSGSQENQGGYVDRYGESQRRTGSGYGTDEDYEYGLGRYSQEDQDYRYGYGRDYNRNYGRGDRPSANRGYEYGQGYGWDQANDETGDYHRDYYANHERRYGDPRRRQTGYSRDYGRDYGEYSNRSSAPGSAYPAAGMGADYGSRADYDERDMNDEDVNFGEGDVGYESEGAFYQDMDEPVNNESQDYQSGSGVGWFRGGMGPQGYQRSDERITEDVCERLTRHGRIDASDIEIDVKDGEVYLKGSVPDRQMKRLAEDVADDISGVKDVHNEIKVEQQNRYTVNNWQTPKDRQNNQDWGNAQSDLNQEARQRSQDWDVNAETTPAGGESNVGAGFESAGATSMEGLESVEQETPNPQGVSQEMDYAGEQTQNRKGVREGMEVIGSGGQIVGRVKEIRANDFLVDREMTRDVYVPYSAVDSVGEQILLNVSAHDVDDQGWEKPALM